MVKWTVAMVIWAALATQASAAMCGDTNNDAQVNGTDALVILREAVGLESGMVCVDVLRFDCYRECATACAEISDPATCPGHCDSYCID